MAEKSRRGFAAGVVGAGCTLRLAPALYGVTGIGQSKWGRQLLLRLSTQAPSRGCPLRGTQPRTFRIQDGTTSGVQASECQETLPFTTPPTTAYTLEPVTRLLPSGPPPDTHPPRTAARPTEPRLESPARRPADQANASTAITQRWSTSMARRRASKACRFRRDLKGTTSMQVPFGSDTRLQTVRPPRALLGQHGPLTAICSLLRALTAAQRGPSRLVASCAHPVRLSEPCCAA